MQRSNTNLVTMTFWRAAGLTYINYSTIAARCTREALKKGVDANAEKRGITSIKFQNWENGKPVGKKE